MRKFAPFAAVLGVASLTMTMVFTQPAFSAPESKIWICHATGSESNPYVRIRVDAEGLNGHGGHSGDLIPAPQGGCPEGPTPTESAPTAALNPHRANSD